MALVVELEDFFAEPACTSAIGDFVAERASTLRIVPGEEQPHEAHGAFLEYTQLIERLLEQFMTEHGVRTADLLDAAQSAPRGAYTWVQFLVASTDYEAFVALVQDFSAMNQWDVDADSEYVAGVRGAA